MDDAWQMLRSMKVDVDVGVDVVAVAVAGATPVKVCGDQTSRCEHCGSCAIHVVEGNLSCTACNSVLGRFIDSAAEWRYYGAEDARGDPSRCCPPANELIPTMGSIVGRCSRRGYHHHQDPGTSSTGRMLQRYQMWNSLSYRERTLCGVFDLLSVSAAQHGISTCILEEAKALYKRISEAKISRGENRNAMVACSLYMSCKSNKVPRSIKEIAAMFNLRVSAMTKSCRMFQRTVNMDVASSCPLDFVGRFCSRMGMPQPAIDATRHVVAKAEELGVLCESTPPAVVAGAIQLVNVYRQLDIDKSAISEVCMVSPVTVSKCFKRLEMYRDRLLPAGV
jgi:transcription initiation factor TFIIB